MESHAPPLSVLFLCTGNSCRSQMAEGWARRFHATRFRVASAGVAPQALDPRAVQVMAEAGVDISQQRPSALAEIQNERFDCVVTVCDAAREACPVFPGATRQLHRSFDDPPRLARGARNEAEVLSHYRRVRDEIRAFVFDLPALLVEEARDSPGH